MITKQLKNYILKIFWDGVLLSVAFIAAYYIKFHSLFISRDILHFLFLLITCWFITTVFSQKFNNNKIDKKDFYLKPFIISLFLMAGFISLFIFITKQIYFPRFIMFGTLGIYFLLEILFLSGKYFYPFYFKKNKEVRHKRSFLFFIMEILLFLFVFWGLYFIKKRTLNFNDQYIVLFVGMDFIILFFGVLIHKYNLLSTKNYLISIWPFIKSMLFTVSSISIFIYLLRIDDYSRILCLGSLIVFYLIELFIVSLYFLYVKPQESDEPGVDLFHAPVVSGISDFISETKTEITIDKKYFYNGSLNSKTSVKDKLKNVYLKKSLEVFDFINEIVELDSLSFQESSIIRSADPYNIEVLQDGSLSFIMNLHVVNDFRRINKYFIEVNNKIKDGGVFVGCFSPLEKHREKIFNKYPKYLAGIIYFFDFIWKRIFPKLPVTQKVYFALTKGRKRVLSKAQCLGRLYYCGFEVLAVKPINDCLYFITKKVKLPLEDDHPSYGPLFKMKRFGKDGKPIYVYKFRTMHPYSEYLQDYILNLYGYGENGKPFDDFRVTSWGRIFRKYWLDELPQLLNVLKGDMKLVGVRPLSYRFLKEYPKDVLEMRFKYKPGCVPPYVALKKQAVEEYIESERIYLLEKEKHPLWTDIKYFSWAMYNIITNKIRSA